MDIAPDLTDEELADNLSIGAKDCSCTICRLGREVRRHRAAQTASAERVRATVRHALNTFIANDGPVATQREIDAIADRVAAQMTAEAK
jgi:hypothetical protein